MKNKHLKALRQIRVCENCNIVLSVTDAEWERHLQSCKGKPKKQHKRFCKKRKRI
jgi:hypothetical protein